MATNKKISELELIPVNDYLHQDDEFVFVDKSEIDGIDASSSGKTSRVTLAKLSSSLLEIGNPGPPGEKGDKGDTGATGSAGSDGTNGTNGTNGDKGQKGLGGTNGSNGTNGTNGNKGQKGQGGASGGAGSKGQKGELGPEGGTPTFNGLTVTGSSNLSASVTLADYALFNNSGFQLYGKSMFIADDSMNTTGMHAITRTSAGLQIGAMSGSDPLILSDAKCIFMGQNVGITQYTPTTVHSSYATLQVGVGGRISTSKTGGTTYFSANAYIGGDNSWKASQSAGGSILSLSTDGDFRFYSFPSVGANAGTSNTETFHIYANGSYGSVQGNVVAKNIPSSEGLDVRDVENIRSAEFNGLDTINDIKVREFEFKGETKSGVLAQELKEVVPAAVFGDESEVAEVPLGESPFATLNDVDLSKELQSVDVEELHVPMGVHNSELVPALIKAVQELSKKVDELSKD